jgi:hypothetical protein
VLLQEVGEHLTRMRTADLKAALAGKSVNDRSKFLAGNPVGAPRRITLDLTGLPAATRDGRLREALSQVLEYAVQTQASAVAVEDLNFEVAEKSRDAHGGKRSFRRLLTEFPTAQVRERLPRMAGLKNLAIIAVDPAYTSRVGGTAWQRALSDDSVIVTRHEGAAVAIGRRALAYGLTARPRGRARQRFVPHQRDGSTTGLAGQERAPASAARPHAARGDHNRVDAFRTPPRRPPRLPAVHGQSGVDPVGRPTDHSQAGHRSAGATAPG